MEQLLIVVVLHMVRRKHLGWSMRMVAVAQHKDPPFYFVLHTEHYFVPHRQLFFFPRHKGLLQVVV